MEFKHQESLPHFIHEFIRVIREMKDNSDFLAYDHHFGKLSTF